MSCYWHVMKRTLKKFILGFDLSEYDKPINNIYKGTDNYLPASAKGFSNPVNWIGQMSEIFDKYKNVTFYWVDCKVSGGQTFRRFLTSKDYHSNVRFLTKTNSVILLEYCKYTKHTLT